MNCEKIEEIEEETNNQSLKFLVVDEIVSCNEILEHIQWQMEDKQTADSLWGFKRIVGHQGQSNQVKIATKVHPTMSLLNGKMDQLHLSHSRWLGPMIQLVWHDMPSITTF
jgi:hypothetical protein